MDLIIFSSKSPLIRIFICLLFPLLFAFSLTCLSFSMSANYDASIDYMVKYVQEQNPDRLYVEYERESMESSYFTDTFNQYYKRDENKSNLNISGFTNKIQLSQIYDASVLGFYGPEKEHTIWYFAYINIVEYNKNNLPPNSKLIKGRYPNGNYQQALITKSQYEYMKKHGGYYKWSDTESLPTIVTPIWVEGASISDDNILGLSLLIKSDAGSVPIPYSICGIIDIGDDLNVDDKSIFHHSLDFFSKTIYVGAYENNITSHFVNYAGTSVNKYEQIKKEYFCLGPYEYDALYELFKYQEGYGYSYEIQNVDWPKGYYSKSDMSKVSTRYRNYFFYLLAPTIIFGLMFAYSNISVILDKNKTYKLKGCFKEFKFFFPTFIISFALTTIVYLITFIHKFVTFSCPNMFIFPSILYGFLIMIASYVLFHLIAYFILYVHKKNEYVKMLEAQTKAR